jgi:hypothetical protein
VIERVLVRLEALPGRCGWWIWLEFLAWVYCTNSDQAEISQIAHSVLNEMCFLDFSSHFEVLAIRSHDFKSVNKHRIAQTEEPVLVLERLIVSRPHRFVTGEGGDQHQQR